MAGIAGVAEYGKHDMKRRDDYIIALVSRDASKTMIFSWHRIASTRNNNIYSCWRLTDTSMHRLQGCAVQKAAEAKKALEASSQEKDGHDTVTDRSQQLPQQV